MYMGLQKKSVILAVPHFMNHNGDEVAIESLYRLYLPGYLNVKEKLKTRQKWDLV